MTVIPRLLATEVTVIDSSVIANLVATEEVSTRLLFQLRGETTKCCDYTTESFRGHGNVI